MAAKKKVTKKATKSKATATRKKAAGAKTTKATTTANKVAKKKAAKSTASKKTTAKKKAATKKAVTKKAVTKKAAPKKAATKKAATKKAATKKAAPKKVATKKATTKKATTKKATATQKKAAPQKTAAARKQAAPAATRAAKVAPKKKAPRRTARKPAPPAEPVESPFERLNRELPESQLRRVKSGLSRAEVNELRNALLEHRAELLGDVAGLDEALIGDADGSSSVPLHMADVGTEHYDREFNLGLLEHERQTLSEIHEALLRMENGTYGVCVNSGQPIGKVRLAAKPWAKYHMDIIRERERFNLV